MKRAPFAFALAALAAAGLALPASAAERPCAASDFTVARFFDTLPVDLGTVAGLVPLGNVNGTSHIVPISTTYFYAPFTFGGADGHPMLPAVTDVPIRIPGDATITSLRWEPNSGGALFAGDDWYVTFRPCREIRFTYHHLNAITGPRELVERAAQVRAGVNAFCTYDDAGRATSCSGLAHVPVRSGAVVGKVFRRNQVSFNLTALDTRAPDAEPAPPPGAAVVPGRYELTYAQVVAALTAAGVPVPPALTPALFAELDPSRTHIRCPLDYFAPAARAALYAKLGSFDGTIPRTVDPRCGQVFQDDLDGGLQGGWFPEGLTAPFLLGSEDILVAFLHGDVDPFRLYFSIGPAVAPLGRTITFPYPGFDGIGAHNLSFKGARWHPELPLAGQPLYCWDGLATAETDGGAAMVPEPVPGVMLAQFASATRVRFEYSPAGNCGAPAFGAAAAYFVR
jgi:hypothetical protein